MDNIKVIIRLTDFTELSKAEIKYFFEDKEVKCGNNVEFVRYCLDGADKKSLDLNRRKVNLYNLFGNSYYTDGYIGVLSSTVITDKSFNPVYQVNTDAQNVKDQGYQKVEAVIEIRSRLDKNPQKPYFLSTMLMESAGLKASDTLVPSNDEDFFDFLLIFLFKQQLETACAKGFYKTYVTFEENDDRPRGTIDIDRHIRLNIGQNNGKIAYSYRESTYNNPFNHLIMCAYEYLRKKFPDQTESIIDDCEAYYAIRQLRTLISYTDYKNSIMIAKNLRPITHPFFLEYETLRKTCIMILRDEGVSIFSGDEDETRSILFYLPDLWELYLENHIKTSKSDYSVRSQFPLDVLSNEPIKKNDIESILPPANFGEISFKLPTRPDFVFVDKDGLPFMILDAKFKPEKWSSKGNSVSANPEDYTKCIRDMTDLNAHATGVIYPTESTGEKASAHYINQYNLIDHFYFFPVSIPEVEKDQSYTDWYKQLSANIDRTAEKIDYYVKREKLRFDSIHEHMMLLKQQNDSKKS